MVRADLGVTSSTELDGATLCTNQGTTNVERGGLFPRQ